MQTMTATKTVTNLDEISDGAVVPTSPEMIAILACSYSREFILKGMTQLVNNTYDKSQRLSLYNAVMDLRQLCNDLPNFSLEINQEFERFHRVIEVCKKLSLGNCYEMALMALDYVLRYAPPSVNAEVYDIEGGDHVFLVLGREKNSNPYEPETWGKDAYICDPWSNKVYPASEYFNETKNYRFFRECDGDYSNHLENFDKDLHTLSPMPLLNTEYLRNAHSRPHLDRIIVFFQKKMDATLKALEKLETNLRAIMRRLEEKYPNDSQKKEIIEKMVNNLHATIEKIKDDIKKDYTTLPYDTLRSNLENSSKKSLSSFQKAVNVNDIDKTVLMKYHDEESYLTKILRFFNIKPKTARDTHNALNEAHQSVEKISKNN